MKPSEYLFVFRDGKFHPGDPLKLDAEDDIDAALYKRDFHLSQQVGADSGLSYQLWESTKSGWIVMFQTAGRCSWILVEGWGDLIELLGKLSTIALVGVLSEFDADGRRCPPHFPISPVKAYPPARKAAKQQEMSR